MQILNSSIEDIDIMFQLYDAATVHQKKVGNIYWKGFERSMVEREIEERRQYKIVVGDQIACVFCIALSDPLIWKEKDKDPAVYIHRIATNPEFRGNEFVKHIVEWAKKYAKDNGKLFIRLDTGSGNDKLNKYYMSCGFNYLGISLLDNTDGLPAHYKDGSFSLFEMPVV